MRWMDLCVYWLVQRCRTLILVHFVSVLDSSPCVADLARQRQGKRASVLMRVFFSDLHVPLGQGMV